MAHTSQRTTEGEHFEQADVREQRHDIIRQMISEGSSRLDVWHRFKKDPELNVLMEGCSNQYRLIVRDYAECVQQVKRPVSEALSPEDLEMSLSEYCMRLDRIYSDAWRKIRANEYDGVYEYRELIKLAAAAAKDKARAMGVSTDVPPLPGKGMLPGAGTNNIFLPGTNPTDMMGMLWGLREQLEELDGAGAAFEPGAPAIAGPGSIPASD